MEKDKNRFDIRTDLALEEQERFQSDCVEISGVELHQWEHKEKRIHLSQVIIKTEEGATAMGKPIGRYLTLEAPGLAEKDENFHKEVTETLAEHLLELLQLHHVENVPILVIGLGNSNATPDALGPKVLEHLQVTRHLYLEYGQDFCEKHGYPVLSGLTPGVMGQTGMESAEIIRGVVKETKPGAVIVVDALAARNVRRLGVTLQLADTGIHPGSGVGNHRNELTEEVLGIPVLALGVPTVIEYADPKASPMYVTPHDIDERVEVLSYTISEAIHEALFR
ncbi:MAG: GPR endopeptidase [Lachnospiraceae bacterium]|nr:GPR endopeptidase [Lachnospiraceae bacterium]